MAVNYADTVNAFYLAYYGRPADPGGLAFWTAALEKNNGDFSAIVSTFANSPEATARFASESVSDRVSDIYQQLFGRAPDKEGLDFWVQAISSGRLTMANAAIEIMHGAQTSDAQTSTLRQQVAAQFTAEVKASGVAYDGAAAVQAARVLISAVNADSKPADLDSLVKAGASLVQTAHDNPAIITALANGGDLSAVLNTASGKADPVAVVQALASIGKAALTDSAGLSTLLQGGGMAGLLNSLPAGTSVKDVAAAVSNGGLSAGADAVKPAPAVPADTTPPAAPSVQLVQDTGLSATDHVTSNGKIQIGGVETGAAWQYSLDAGKTWATGAAANADGTAVLDTTVNGEQTLQVRAVDAAGNASAATSFQYTLRTSIAPTMLYVVDGKEIPGLDTLSVNSPDYLVHIYGTSKGTGFYFEVSDSGKDGSWTTIKDTDPLSEGLHYIRYVATDLAGNIGATNALKLVMDLTAPAAPKVALVQDTGVSTTDHFTSDGHIQVSGIEAQGSWEYSFDGKTWTTGPAANTDGVAVLATTTNGAQTLQVRSHDLARNTSEVVKFDYTLQTSFTPTIAFRDGANGADLPGASLLTNTDDFWITLHGGLDAAKVVFQVSDSGKDGTWMDADMSAPFTDGTHYIRDVVTDRAGNTGTTNALRVDMDKTPPPAPTAVELKEDTGVAGDLVTTNGNFVVRGLQQGVAWQFSSDGKTWYQGTPAGADGTATGYAQSTGEQTLQVRTLDLAGNTSAAVSLHFTLDTHLPALDPSLNGANPTSHLLQTSAAKTDLVFSYTGTIADGDSFDYTPMFQGDDASTWIKIDSSMIDTVNKTITIKDFDLNSADAFLTLRGSNLAGNIHYQASIDGPYTSYFTSYSAAGMNVLLSGQFTAKAYLTDGSNAPVQLTTLDASGNLVNGQQATMIGAQATAVQGVLGAGNDALAQTIHDKGVYAFGTTGDDTLSGNYVWGFGGNDTITATGSANYNSALLSGGAGADTIHTETSSSVLMYAGSAESFLAADEAVAHGFDTAYLSNGGSTSYTDVLNFEDIKLGDFYVRTGAANFSGSETGNELLAMLETAVAGSFNTGESLSQAALVSFGTDNAGHNLNFLVVDADKDGHVGSGDYVVKIVGSIGTSSVTFDAGMFTINTMVTN